MPIHDQSYRHWDGRGQERTYTRWWVITKAELKLLTQRKLVRLIVAIPPAIYVLVHAVLIYIINQTPTARLPIEIDPRFFNQFLLRIEPVPSGLFIALIGIFGGAGLISNDLKHNALQLYLSKPISWTDYLIGKFAVMVILLASITLVPALLLFAENMLLTEDSGFIRKNYWVIFSIILYSLIIIVPSSILILALSSLTSNARYSAIAFGTILVGTPLVYEILRQITHSSKMAVISIWANYDILGSKLFGLRPGYAVDWFWSVLTLVGMIAMCLWLLHRRIKAVKIVK